MAHRFLRLAPALLLLLPACGGGTTGTDGGPSDLGGADGGRTDAGGADGGGADTGPVDLSLDTGGADLSFDAGGADLSFDAGGTDAAQPDAGRAPTNHRPTDGACTATAPAGTCGTFGGGFGACMHDADCTTGTNGRCNMNLGGAAICFCSYDACAHDTDCATGELCACHGSPYHADGNACIAGNCRVDSDCGGGTGYCSPSMLSTGCGGLGGYYCHTATDLCLDDADCTGLDACEFVAASSRWECVARLFCP